jgi:hypothetical protein
MIDERSLDAKIDAEIDAVLKAKLAREREEIAFQLRRKANAAEYDRITADGRPLIECLSELLPEADAPKVVALPGRGQVP